MRSPLFGTLRPVSLSRTISATASSSGASAWSRTSARLALAYLSSSMEPMLSATPSMAREPIASTRACSTASKIARACLPSGASFRCRRVSWQARLSAIESPRPRVTATSFRLGFLGSSGSRARLPASAGRSLAKPTSRSWSPAIARTQTAMARRKVSPSPPPFALPRVELSPGPAIAPLVSRAPHWRPIRAVPRRRLAGRTLPRRPVRARRTC